MTVQTQETLLKKLNAIDQMPTLPVVLTPLLHYMEQPLERLEVQQVVDLISQDKSLTAPVPATREFASVRTVAKD